MAVQRALARIERALDLGASHESIANLPHVAAPGPEDRERRPRPEQDPNGDASRNLRQQLPHDDWSGTSREREVGRHVPARDMNVRSCFADGEGHCLQCIGAIDQNLERVAGTGRWVTFGPNARARVDRSGPSHSAQPSTMM